MSEYGSADGRARLSWLGLEALPEIAAWSVGRLCGLGSARGVWVWCRELFARNAANMLQVHVVIFQAGLYISCDVHSWKAPCPTSKLSRGHNRLPNGGKFNKVDAYQSNPSSGR